MSSNAMPPSEQMTHGSPSTPQNFQVATADQLTGKFSAAYENDDRSISRLIDSFPFPPNSLRRKSNVENLRRESLSAQNSPNSNRKRDTTNLHWEPSFHSGSPQLPLSPLAERLQRAGLDQNLAEPWHPDGHSLDGFAISDDNSQPAGEQQPGDHHETTRTIDERSDFSLPAPSASPPNTIDQLVIEQLREAFINKTSSEASDSVPVIGASDHSSDGSENTEERVQGISGPYHPVPSFRVLFGQHGDTELGAMQPSGSTDPNAPVAPVSVPLEASASALSEMHASDVFELDAFATRIATTINFLIESITPRSVLAWKREGDKLMGEVSIFINSLFSDVCITDNNLTGHPVRMFSEAFLPGSASTSVGALDFLNLPDGMNRLINQTVRIEVGTDGRPRFILTFWGKFHTKTTGAAGSCESNLGWAASVDITQAVRLVAGIIQPQHTTGTLVGSYPSSTSSLESGTRVTDGRPELARSTSPVPEGQWMSVSNNEGLANEEDLANEDMPNPLPMPIVRTYRPIVLTPELAKVLLFISDLQMLHSCILLFKPSSDEHNTAEQAHPFSLKWVSATVAENTEDLKAYFSKMTVDGRFRLSHCLSGNQPRRTDIAWGAEAENKRLYCMPVTDGRADPARRRAHWWMCFMVNDQTVDLWQ